MPETKRPHILEAIDTINNEIPFISKDKQGHGYKYRGIEDVLLTLNPLMKKNHVILKSEVLREHIQMKTGGKAVMLKHEEKVGDTKTEGFREELKQIKDVTYIIKYTFMSLIDGSEISTMVAGEGSDSSGGDKNTGIAFSNALKYAIFQFFTIPTDATPDSDDLTAIQEGVQSKFKKADTSVAPVTTTAPIETVATETSTSFRRVKKPAKQSEDAGGL